MRSDLELQVEKVLTAPGMRQVCGMSLHPFPSLFPPSSSIPVPFLMKTREIESAQVADK